MGYQEKIEWLSPWLQQIVEVVKKDLKNEHLKIDRAFCKRYFLGKSAAVVTVAEMTEAYKTDIAQGNVGLAEFIATRWLLKNTDVYGYFEESLKKITPDFDKLQTLPSELVTPLMEGAIKEFGATRTYLFSVFNSVLFPKELYEQLREQALRETMQASDSEARCQVEESLQQMQRRLHREMDAMRDRHEKKLSGLQRKYLQDTEVLKKQIRNLQKKLDG